MRPGRFFPAAAGLLLLALLSACSLPAAANRYALVYGVADYQTVTPDLTWTTNDAIAVTSALESAGWTVLKPYAGSTTATGLDGDASLANIQADIAALSAYGSDASVLLYFSGHGASDGAQAFIVPWDATEAVATLISASELNSLMSALPARNRVVILDTCFSGGFVPSGGTLDLAPPNYGYGLDAGGDPQSLLGTYPGRALANLGRLLAGNVAGSDPDIISISAAGSNELSYENSGVSHGIFTWALLNSQRSGDRDGDSLVTASEAYAWIAAQLNAEWNLYYPEAAYYPHLSGTSRDIVLFDNR